MPHKTNGTLFMISVSSKNKIKQGISYVMLISAAATFLFWAFCIYEAKYGMHGFGGGLALGMLSYFALIASLCLSAASLSLMIIYELKNQNSTLLIYSFFLSIAPITGLLIMDYI